MGLKVGRALSQLTQEAQHSRGGRSFRLGLLRSSWIVEEFLSYLRFIAPKSWILDSYLVG